MNHGTCLCGSVTWELSGEPFAAYNCHCKMCRKVHGAAFGTYYFVRADQFRWTAHVELVAGMSRSIWENTKLLQWVSHSAMLAVTALFVIIWWLAWLRQKS